MKTKRLLLVEDNPDDELLTRRALEKFSNFSQIDVAHDGVEALQMVSIGRDLVNESTSKVASHPLPNLILLDLKMPRLNGHEFLKILRDNPSTAHIPVVVLTTSSESKDIAKSYELGANSFLRKPVNFLDFGKSIERLSHYWLEMNIPSPRVP